MIRRDGSVALVLAMSERIGQNAPRATVKVAPTDDDGLFFRLMPIGADKSAMGAINRPLRVSRFVC